MKKIFTIVLLLNFSWGSYSQDLNDFFQKADTFFQTHVKNGKVAYDDIHDNTNNLNELLALAKQISVSKTDSDAYQAFWINAYNLSVIKGLITNYPINSPLDKSGFFDKTTYALGGMDITLNDIENKLLRAQFNDARFHFVLVCGAIGCPPLISKAYQPATLDKQLQQQTITALNDPKFIMVKKGKVALSEIFKWYKEDFVLNGNEIDYINAFRKVPLNSDSKITYYPYNWKINKQ